MKHPFLILALCAVLSPCIATGQCDDDGQCLGKPIWATQTYSKDLASTTLKTIVIVGKARSQRDDALTDALAAAERLRKSALGMGNLNIQIAVHTNTVGEYWERDTWYFLIQTKKDVNSPADRVTLCCHYGFKPAVLVPGMAQIQKGSTGKGVGFILAEAAFIGGVVGCESLRASYEAKINTSHSDKQTYIDLADTYENVRNGFIAGAIVVYVWNIVDGVVGKGKQRVITMGDAKLQFAPYATPQSGGMALVLNF